MPVNALVFASVATLTFVVAGDKGVIFLSPTDFVGPSVYEMHRRGKDKKKQQGLIRERERGSLSGLTAEVVSSSLKKHSVSTHLHKFPHSLTHSTNRLAIHMHTLTHLHKSAHIHIIQTNMIPKSWD